MDTTIKAVTVAGCFTVVAGIIQQITASFLARRRARMERAAKEDVIKVLSTQEGTRILVEGLLAQITALQADVQVLRAELADARAALGQAAEHLKAAYDQIAELTGRATGCKNAEV